MEALEMCVKYVDINGNQNYNPRKHKKGVYRTTAPKVVPLEQQPITDIDMIRNRKKYEEELARFGKNFVEQRRKYGAYLK